MTCNSASNTVAFSAWRASRDAVSSGAVIIYENVDVNVGGAYDAATGIFTCPVDGYYMFSVFTMTESGASIFLVISFSVLRKTKNDNH